MRAGVRVKICGLTRPGDARAAVAVGAAYIGLVFFARSPRHVGIEQAREIALEVAPGRMKVGLFVDPDDATLDAVLARVPLDMLQLHGSESPVRVAALRRRAGLPVMKALAVATSADVSAATDYADAADQILFDARPPEGAARPGGHGRAFDWTLLAAAAPPLPWMLAGGLTPGAVGRAIAESGARAVDVSSGVESAPGVKDPERMRAFVAACDAVAPA